MFSGAAFRSDDLSNRNKLESLTSKGMKLEKQARQSDIKSINVPHSNQFLQDLKLINRLKIFS